MSNINTGLNLKRGQQSIVEQIKVQTEEKISLASALGRVSSRKILTPEPIPTFSQSLMDGFALQHQKAKSPQEYLFHVVGEIAAGQIYPHKIQRGQAVRIYTGAKIPEGTNQVIPMENCLEAKGYLKIIPPLPNLKYIKKKGSDFAKGSLVINSGVPFSPKHLSTLAVIGETSVSVHRPPHIAFFCSGSELETPASDQSNIATNGRKYESNSILLESLVKQSGAVPFSLGSVIDNVDAICSVFKEWLQKPVWGKSQPILISTGGMGPGKYDLITAALKKIGAKIIFDRLAVHPGSRTLFAKVDKGICICLPGSPPAVFTLFHELVKPAILKACGQANPYPEKLRATLTESITTRHSGPTHLKPGITKNIHGKISVRPTNPYEPANAIILVPARRRFLKKGELVTFHPI